MNIVLIILGLIIIGVVIASLVVKAKNSQAQSVYDKIVETLTPYLEKDDSAKLGGMLEAIKEAESGKKEIKTSSNTATLAKYQRKAQTLEANIAALVADVNDLDGFNSEEQIKRYVKSTFDKLLVKSGIVEWVPQIGETFNSESMIKIGQGFKVTSVMEIGYKTEDEIILKARVRCE